MRSSCSVGHCQARIGPSSRLSIYTRPLRVWFAAALYRTGKAPWVLVAGGSRYPIVGRQGEAIREMLLLTLGVPRAAIGVARGLTPICANANDLQLSPTP